MKTSKEGKNLIKRHEGLVLEAYNDGTGTVTIGYGHTNLIGTWSFDYGAVITKERAIELLEMDLAEMEKYVNTYCAGILLDQGQFDSLVSFTFQFGPGTLANSTILKKLKAGDPHGAGDAFMDPAYLGEGLYESRRADERKQFLKMTLFLDKVKEVTQMFTNCVGWMFSKLNIVTYSMDNRYGPLSYDCSSAVYYALINGGFFPKNISIGNTDTLFSDLELRGWQKLSVVNGQYETKKGDVFIWGVKGNSKGPAGHTGIFYDDNDKIIHCNASANGFSINDYNTTWANAGKPIATIYRYVGGSSTGNLPLDNSKGKLIPYNGIFYPNIKLPVSADTDPNSNALAWYDPGMAIPYDNYIFINGYAWISYIAESGARRYIAVGPDDGNVNTVWGTGFLNNQPAGQTIMGQRIPYSGTFYPEFKLPVSGDTDPDSPALAWYDAGMAVPYDSYIFANGFAWISYIAGSGVRRYIAVGPDDGNVNTVWGTGFLGNYPMNSSFGKLNMYSDIFYPNIKLPVSADTNPNSDAIAWYNPGTAIIYDSYIFVNGYAWISYIASSGARHYIAVGPDDGRTDTVWGEGFLNNHGSVSQNDTSIHKLIPYKGTFVPSIKLPVSADTNPNSDALAWYDAGSAIIYDSYIFVNGYAWISYIASSGVRRYIAVGPDDGNVNTVWGTGFLS